MFLLCLNRISTHNRLFFGLCACAYSVFAPLDSAFEDALAAGVISNGILHDKEWGLHLDKLLRHHVVLDSIVLTNQMQKQVAEQQQSLTMASGEKVALGTKTMTDGGGDMLGLGKKGEVSFIEANVVAENGVLHVINGLLQPKFLSMTVMDILQQKENLSTFASLLVMAGLDEELRNVDAAYTVSVNVPRRLGLAVFSCFFFFLGSHSLIKCTPFLLHDRYSHRAMMRLMLCTPRPCSSCSQTVDETF
jgi:Fasciclin domain